MERSQRTLEELYRVIPDVEEFETLRLAIIGAAVPDPATLWARSSASATIDKRVVPADRIEQVVDEAEAALHAYIASVFSTFRPLFRTFQAGKHIEVAYHLVELGERQEAHGRYRKARRCFDSALDVALPLTEKGPQILALRSIGRVARTLGDLHEALEYYRRSAELACDAQDLKGEVIAQTGYANVLAAQGRWGEAERCYREVLAKVDERGEAESLRLQQAQLYNNLGMIATRQHHLSAAEEWLERALRQWAVLDSPVDVAVCYYNRGFLREQQERLSEAHAVYEQALALDIPPGMRVGIMVQLADLHVKQGQLRAAEARGREAEQLAITAQSPYYLAEMYRGLGNIARAKGDHDGFTFFEKALEITREKDYRLLAAKTLTEYSVLRSEMGEWEEAISFLERAREIFSQLGAVHEQARAEHRLEALLHSRETRRAAD
ncbi:MAG TPA: tetratricopeptide repeat protein [Longimicrobiaceae bacterium]|nr:tetratricopeptide repeat protein [Longimicrobiaceae bacterium]